ncbi:hypothetical protein CDL15_Pgr026279 [Punica granatum]|nr:hypothetical protein CDL15_Pgr026279 [Punica granatum]
MTSTSTVSVLPAGCCDDVLTWSSMSDQYSNLGVVMSIFRVCACTDWNWQLRMPRVVSSISALGSVVGTMLMASRRSQ